MRKTKLLLGAGIAVCVVVARQPASMQSPAPERATPSVQVVAAAPPRTVANVPMPTLTPAEQAALARVEATRLAATRGYVADVAQRAVRDSGEGLFREPTAAEAAALALPAASGVAQEVPLSIGGYAVKTDPSALSLVVATAGKDGVVTGHQAKGARRDR